MSSVGKARRRGLGNLGEYWVEPSACPARQLGQFFPRREHVWFKNLSVAHPFVTVFFFKFSKNLTLLPYINTTISHILNNFSVLIFSLKYIIFCQQKAFPSNPKPQKNTKKTSKSQTSHLLLQTLFKIQEIDLFILHQNYNLVEYTIKVKHNTKTNLNSKINQNFKGNSNF